MIIRVAKRYRFTVLSNKTIEDKRLSWEALGLLTYLLSKPDGWKVRREQLQAERSAGQDKLKRILGELSAAGYYVRSQTRQADGTFVWENLIREESDNPVVDNPPVDSPVVDDPPLSNTDVAKTEIAKTEEDPSPTDLGQLTLTAPELDDRLAPEDLVESWNEFARKRRLGLVRDLTGTRRKKTLLRLREHPEVQFWSDVLTGIDRSPFLLGLTAGGNGHEHWRLTFDFLVDNDTNAVRITEGAYAEKTAPRR